ncbi:FAD-dependent monooxygenase [Streptomyces sp. DfronAA-171]|uniref:FAD-dependent monooxygenase n=1 Tax=Streptomyces sp. DfronAA-171 TaxID=1839777 RepID=UPI00210C4975|nr:FAD-dependent monooxygenase [Streptomyces sp. DfronAA-171]
MRLAHESIEELNTEESAWRLLAPWGRTPENTTIERHTVYTFQARWVDRWREGRLLLAGDAAHQMPPFAGQGMCSGLRDAVNLAWKLRLVLDGHADAGLLDTYTSERSAHVQHAIAMSMELGKVICVLDPEEARARDTRMIAAGADPARALPEAPPPVLGDGVLQRAADGGRAAGAGHLTPQFPVTHEGRTELLDELTGGGLRAPHRRRGAARGPRRGRPRLPADDRRAPRPAHGERRHVDRHARRLPAAPARARARRRPRPARLLPLRHGERRRGRTRAGGPAPGATALPAHGTDHAPAPAPHTGATAPEGSPLAAAT